MSSQMQFVNGDPITIGTIGTVVQRNAPCVLERIVIPGTYVGTVNFHDIASAAGTTSTTSKLIIGLPATGVPTSVMCGFVMKKGLVTEATGTPNLTITIG